MIDLKQFQIMLIKNKRSTSKIWQRNNDIKNINSNMKKTSLKNLVSLQYHSINIYIKILYASLKHKYHSIALLIYLMQNLIYSSSDVKFDCVNLINLFKLIVWFLNPSLSFISFYHYHIWNMEDLNKTSFWHRKIYS